MKLFHVLIATTLLSGAVVVQAEDYQHKASGLQMTLPKGWKVTEKGGRLTITNKDKTVNLVGGVIEKTAAKLILGDIDKFLAKIDGFRDAKVVERSAKEEVNGLEQSWFEGTVAFKDDDGEEEELQWDMTIVSGGKAILFLIGTGKLDENEDTYEKLFESIKKIEEDE